jgi:hypothetical protein
MRPVDPKFVISQHFASMPTAGVAPDPDPDSGVGYYVYLYGNYQPDGHAGCDIACPVGTPIHAIAGGTVIWAGWDTELPGGPDDWYARWFFYQHFGGRLTLVQRPSGVIDVYAHQSKFLTTVGAVVKEGQLIGLSGDSSGGADGALAPHLHVEKIVNTGYPTGGGLIYGRTDPITDFTAYKPLTLTTQSVAVAKEDDMPTIHRVPAIVRPAGATKLGANKTWYLKDKTGRANLNLAGKGAGIYDGAVFVQGTGLAPGEVITVNFIVVTNGKRSGYYAQDAARGTRTGQFRGSAVLSGLPLTKGQLLEVSVTSSATGPDLTTYGADLKVWQ